jgi:8-oxo-dGTP pyrophosphatase MutT (NUDIX family)
LEPVLEVGYFTATLNYYQHRTHLLLLHYEMTLQLLTEKLIERLKLPLPGGDAHEQFRARPVGDVKPLFDHKLPPKPGGVIILLFEEDGVVKFPLTKRAEYNGAHSGQISLPGGKAEPGENSIQTALRECEEEIGIPARSIQVIGMLSDFFVMPSNFMVTPVIASVFGAPLFLPDSFEVAKVLKHSVSELVRDDAMKQKEILVAGRYKMFAPHFEIDGEIVWGATAMMLNEFRLVLKDVL